MKLFLVILIICLLALSGAYAEKQSAMYIQVTDGVHTVLFELNSTPAATDLFMLLPLEAEVQNYGSNEKIFYLQEKLNGEDAIETGGDAGGLAYFSPWGNIVMYYGTFNQYPGLYVLGEAVSGADQIYEFSGTLRITAYEWAPDSEPVAE